MIRWNPLEPAGTRWNRDTARAPVASLQHDRVAETDRAQLPAVEAAACGTPVIATTASPLPELLAGGGLFVAPRDINGIAAAMQRLMDDEPGRLALGATARHRAGLLSWDRCARAVLSAIEETAR